MFLLYDLGCLNVRLTEKSRNPSIAKKSFYRSANAIFGKVGRLASEEVTLQLIKSKCIPVLLYGLEACPLNKSDLRSLDFVINIFFMKLLVERPALAVRLDLSFRSVYFFFSGNIFQTAEPISTKVCTVTASGQE